MFIRASSELAGRNQTPPSRSPQLLSLPLELRAITVRTLIRKQERTKERREIEREERDNGALA